MAIDRLQALTEQYAIALRNYCLNVERDDSTARCLGEQAAAAGLTMSDFIHLYQQSLDALQVTPAIQDGVVLAKLASAFLTQSLLPFEQQRQQTENTLRRSEEQFRTIFDHAAIGIVVTDSEHRIAHANPFFQNTLQYSAAELAEFGLAHVTHPDDLALEQPFVNECLAGTRDTYRLEKRYIRKDGESIWSDMTGTVVRDAIGQIQFAVVTMADTTAQQTARQERKQVEAALQQLNVELESQVQARTAELAQKNTELEALFRILPDLFFRVAADGTYLECKGQSPQDFYLPPEALVGRTVQDVLPTPLGQAFHATFQDVLRHNELVSMEYALTIEGTEQYYEAWFVPLQPDQVMAIVRNISDRKHTKAAREQAERALRSREAELRRDQALFAGVFEASADAIFLVSPVTGCILNCNQRAVALLEVESREALIGVVGSSFHKAPFLPEDVAIAAIALKTIGGWSHEIEYLTQKGNTFWGHCTAKRIQVDCKPLYLVRVTDITDRKETEQRLQHQAEAAQLLANIVRMISQSAQLKEVLELCLEQTRQFLQCDRVLIGRFNQLDTIVIELEAVSEPTFSLLGQTLHNACFDPEWVRYCQGHIAAYNDSQNEPDTAAIAPCNAAPTPMPVRASLTVPILQANQLWGLLIIHQCDVAHQWQPSEIDLLKQLGLHIGIANQKASLYAQLETELAERRGAEQTIAQQMQRERLLRTLSQQIRQSLRLDQILATTVIEIQRLLEADRAVIFRFNRDRSGVVIQEANLGSYPTVLEMYLTDRHFPQASYDFYLQGQARAVSLSNDSHADCFLEFMERISVKSEIVAPILQTLEDETPVVWGLLIVHACTHDRQWQPDEVALLQQLATQVGIAIQQANLYTQLKNELTQKEVLIKEIHHRVKNNLQVVSALLTLQADSTQDATVLAALQDSNNRLQAMALIHEILYQSDNLEQLNFSDYIQRLADSILFANSKYINSIKLTYKLEPVFLNLDTAIPCGLLLNELVTNAIKHAFPAGRQGTICVSLQRAPNKPMTLLDQTSSTPLDQTISTAPTITTAETPPQEAPCYVLSVSDNGIGIPANLSLETIKSLGLRIASDLTQQLRGLLVLERHHGTQFHLTFADLSYRKRF